MDNEKEVISNEGLQKLVEKNQKMFHANMYDEEIFEAMNRILIPIINDIANNPEKHPEITETETPSKELMVAMHLKNAENQNE